MLESLRLVFLPVVNPGGVLAGSRANPQGVDLMRNAPQDADRGVPFLVGGHRLSPHLPYYRGLTGAPLQVESDALCRFVREELLGRPISVAIDFHSGFGLRDRIWFPYARTRRPMHHLAEIHALCEVLDQCLSPHPYVMEPQSRHYLTHGDLWDHLYDESLSLDRGIFLPMTLEMRVMAVGEEKPAPATLPARHVQPADRTSTAACVRRHMAWMDFMTRATQSALRWLLVTGHKNRSRGAGVDSLVSEDRSMSVHTWVLLRGLTRESGHWSSPRACCARCRCSSRTPGWNCSTCPAMATSIGRAVRPMSTR